VRQKLESTTDILSKLFPSPSLESLDGLTREQLLEKLRTSLGQPAQQSPNQIPLQLTDFIDRDSSTASYGLAQESEHVEILGRDQDGRPPESEYDDESSDPGDDVNALSAPANQPSSYVGPSSTMQMFRTILRIAPEPSEQEQRNARSPATATNRCGSIRSPSNAQKAILSPPVITERVKLLVDSYFDWIHPATPIVDERNFRNIVFMEARSDPPWLCLFNMVLAMGALGLNKIDSKEHFSYYSASKSHLDLEGLGNKSFEVLQALILMAGWYNHYRNRPNLASALLGAALRMAYALGLHKEIQHTSNQPPEACELRRMIWWNLITFDAAEAVTLGRTLDSKIFETEVDFPGCAQQVVSSLAALYVSH
jgi:hypothetical protein